MKTAFFNTQISYSIYILKGINNNEDEYYLSQKKKRLFNIIKPIDIRIIRWQFFASDDGGWPEDLFFKTKQKAIEWAESRINANKPKHEKAVKVDEFI